MANQIESSEGFDKESETVAHDNEWKDFFMAIAMKSAENSRDSEPKVGACLVNSAKEIVGTGCDKMPNGFKGNVQQRERYMHVCHAEMNAIINAIPNKVSNDLSDCTLYVGLHPCNECTKLIIQSGIKEVFYLSDKKQNDDVDMKASKKMIEHAGIRFSLYKPTKKKVTIAF